MYFLFLQWGRLAKSTCSLISCAGLQFGTAGLRAPMGADFSRINSLTTIQTSQDVAEYFLSEVEGAAQLGVVTGYDARHNSKKFAATAFSAKGIRIWWYEDMVHTPLVPFGVTLLRAVSCF